MKKEKKIYTSFIETEDGAVEMIFDPVNEKTEFVYLDNGQVKIVESIDYKSRKYYPYEPNYKLLTSKVVLFPSETSEYGNTEDLVTDLRRFIHKYLEISDFIEQIAPYYVLLTWNYDSFKELPYLRAIGDLGCGKSRFIKVIGSISYKPSLSGGATNPAPIFRILDQFKGTFVIDEGDMRFSDTNNEVVKILNNGFQVGLPVLRCGSSEDNYDVCAYSVFGPKIIATREKFEDLALESRFIVEHMDGRLTRTDIPLNLDDEFDKEALELRNKCLLWRLRNYKKLTIDSSFQDRTIEARLNQVITPLISIVPNARLRGEIMKHVHDYNKELISDRSLNYEAPILMCIINLIQSGVTDIRMEDIAQTYNQSLVRGDKELSGRKIGIIVREKFGFRTERKSHGYVLLLDSYHTQIDKLKRKYGIEDECMNVMNVVDTTLDALIKNPPF